MTARSVYEAATKAAETAKLPTIQLANLTHQITVNANSVDLGYSSNLALGASAAQITATTNANAALAATKLLAEMTKQVAIQSARDTLRSSGDNAPA
jgi:hypothetical protein